MAISGVNGLAVAATAGGAVLVWSGLKGASVTNSLKSLVSGQQPSGTAANPVSLASFTSGTTAPPAGSTAAGDTSAHSASAKTNQATARLLAAPYGWSTGTQWADLVSLWNQESGWSNTAKNPSSGAYGIAQALPPTKYPASGQESGGSHASAQISWGLAYIKSRYGSPAGAWAHEQSAGWY